MGYFARILYISHHLTHSPAVKTSYNSDDIYIEIDWEYIFNNKEMYEKYQLDYTKEKEMGRYPPESRYSPEAVEEFTDLMNSLELCEVDFSTNSIVRGHIRKIWEKENEADRCVYVSVFSNSPDKSPYFFYKHYINGERIGFFDRYVRFLNDSDGTIAFYYIKNYDENAPTVQKLKDIASGMTQNDK